MQVLLAPTENIVLAEKTSLSADEAASQTVLSVLNTSGFLAKDYIVIEEIGCEIAELLQIFSVEASANTITLSTGLNRAHTKDTTITKIRYNKRKFYRCATETGTYTHLSAEGSPVLIQVDQPEGTEFEDTTGTTTSWYKATYFNSETGAETSIDDALASQAGDAEHYTSIYKIRMESGFQNNSYIGSDLIDRYRYEAEAQAEGELVGLYQLPFSSTPKLYQHIITLLAAGLLISKEYGLESDVDISKTGQRKIDRAEELLGKIRDGIIKLVGVDGTELSKRTDVMASCSNKYDESGNKGELFNISDENFNMTDPDDPLASSMRSKVNETGFEDDNDD
ncbi:MAG: hypothetical protein WC438_06070 [Candidatus Pacearchaeota archaeon]